MSSSKFANAIFILALISSILYSLQFVKESMERAHLLSSLDYAARQKYTEKYFKYPAVYEYAQWIQENVPSGHNFSLLDTHTNYTYYYARLCYFLYPKHIDADVKTVTDINNGKPINIKDLNLGDYVFAVDMDEKDRAALSTRYSIAARYEQTRNYILKRK